MVLTFLNEWYFYFGPFPWNFACHFIFFHLFIFHWNIVLIIWIVKIFLQFISFFVIIQIWILSICRGLIYAILKVRFVGRICTFFVIFFSFGFEWLQFLRLKSDPWFVNFGHLDLNCKIAVILFTLFVLVCLVNHILVYVEHARLIDKSCVKPKMKRRLFVGVKLYSDIFKNEQIFLSNKKVDVRLTPHQLVFNLLWLAVVVKDVSLADHLKIGKNASFFQGWYSYHSYFVNFLHHRRTNWQWLIQGQSPPCLTHHLASFKTEHIWILKSPLHSQEVFKVVDVSDLGWNGVSFPIFCPYFAIIYESFMCRTTILWINQIAANHYSCTSLARFAMNCNHIWLFFGQEHVYILTKVVNHGKSGWIVIIKGKIGRRVIKRIQIVSSFRTQIVHFVIWLVIVVQKTLGVFHWVPIVCLEAFRWITHGDNLRSHIG